MAKLRKIQFYRNGQAQTIAVPETGVDLKSAYKQAEQDFIATGKHNDMLDGEILLYRFSYDGTVHTLVGVVHASGTTKSLEVLANYDMLGGEISDAITTALAELDGSATIATVANDVVTLKAGVKQIAGEIGQGNGNDIVLAKVAKTGAAADVSIADAGGIITATNVEDALVEIATEINAMDLLPTDVVALNQNKTALQAAKISETDGKVSVGKPDATLVEFNQALSDSNKVATMADVTAAQNNTTVTGQEAIVVANATGEGAVGKVISLKISNNDNVLTQDEAGLLANIELTYDSDNKKIKLFGKEGKTAATASLGEIDATAFIKDGMLQSATIVSGTWGEDGVFTENAEGKDKAIKLVWNTDAGKEAMFINAETLVDSYTAGNEWIVFDQDTNKISHKTVGETLDSENTHGLTADVSVTNTTSTTFKVPSLKVDAAGHVVTVDEKTVTITLPKSIDTAVQTVTSTEEVNATDKFVAVTTTRTGNDVVLTSNLEIQEIASATATDNGLATALDVKNYVDTNSTTVSGYTKEDTVVTEVVSTENENGSTNYQVKLPEITVQTPDATENSMDNDTNTHTYMTGIETDGFGRVTKVITETMTENINCGTW